MISLPYFYILILTISIVNVSEANCPSNASPSNGKCTLCTPENCSKCPMSPNKCTDCNPKFYLSEKKTCTPCGYEDKCLKCTPTKCLKCENGYYSKEEDKCIDCKSIGCEYCGTEGCTKCKQGYVLGDATCTPCTQHCRECYISGILGDDIDIPICTECENGWGVVSSKCSACEIPRCSACDEDPKKCSRCESGYTPNEDKSSCIECTAGCGECSIPTCTQCLPTYYLAPETKECLSCLPNCKTCTNGVECSECNISYLKEVPASSITPQTPNPPSPTCMSTCPKVTLVSTSEHPFCLLEDTCPPHTYLQANISNCEGCAHGCDTCDSLGCVDCMDKDVFMMVEGGLQFDPNLPLRGRYCSSMCTSTYIEKICFLGGCPGGREGEGGMCPWCQLGKDYCEECVGLGCMTCAGGYLKLVSSLDYIINGDNSQIITSLCLEDCKGVGVSYGGFCFFDRCPWELEEGGECRPPTDGFAVGLGGGVLVVILLLGVGC